MEEHLKVMGYDWTGRGMAVIITERRRTLDARGRARFVESDDRKNRVELAAQIALTTLARDVRESGADEMELLRGHAVTLLGVFKQYHDQGAMRTEVWNSHAKAISLISDPSAQQAEWIDKVLSDPQFGDARLAERRLG